MNLQARWHYQLARFFLFIKREASAIAELNRALELDPRYPEAAESLAYLYAATARPERAVEEFRTALALSPHKAATHFNLGFVYHEQKQYRSRDRRVQ